MLINAACTLAATIKDMHADHNISTAECIEWTPNALEPSRRTVHNCIVMQTVENIMWLR